MPALKDRRYRAVCTNHRRLTGKVLYGAHFPMKNLRVLVSFVFLSISSRISPALCV